MAAKELVIANEINFWIDFLFLSMVTFRSVSQSKHNGLKHIDYKRVHWRVHIATRHQMKMTSDASSLRTRSLNLKLVDNVFFLKTCMNLTNAK